MQIFLSAQPMNTGGGSRGIAPLILNLTLKGLQVPAALPGSRTPVCPVSIPAELSRLLKSTEYHFSLLPVND